MRALAGGAFLLFHVLFYPSNVGAGQSVDPLKVGFVYPGQVGSFGWSFQHDQARRALEEYFGDRIVTSYIEGVPPGSDAEHALSVFARQGYDLVFATSFDFMKSTLSVASRFPDTRFENATGYLSAPNVAIYDARFHEGRSILGVIAAHVTQTNVIGYIASVPVPEVIRGINAFTLALRRINPDAVVKVIFVNSWHDPGRERAVAERLVGMGADVLVQHTDSPVAVQIAQERGIMVFGQSSDMSQFGPESHLTALVDDWSEYYRIRVQAVMDGTWKSGLFIGGIRSGMVKLAPFGPAVSEIARKAADEIRGSLEDGTFFPFCGPVRNQNGELIVGSGDCLPDVRIQVMNWFVEGVHRYPG